jgi:signal transduction histidine kinase
MAEQASNGGPQAAQRNGQAEETERQTILVVDDEAGIRKGCRRVLEAEGYEVLLADTAEQGLDLLRARPTTDLVLADLKMPGLGGLELLAQAKQIAPETVCAVITAYATIETAVEATKRGAYDFLTKPFTPEELLRVVGKALERSRLLRERNRLQVERESRLLEIATEQSRMRTIINSMADGVLVCNADDELVLYNPAALHVLEHLPAGRRVYRLGEVLSSAKLFEMIGDASEGRKRLTQEIQMNGAGQWVLADVSPVVDERSSQFLGTVTVLRDISELKKVEQVKAQFVNMVAHELRSPLAAVDGYLSIMQQGLVTQPEKQTEIIGRSRDRIKALLDLVTDLLDVARMEAGTVLREIEPQAVAGVAGQVLELMEPVAEQRHVALEANIAEDLPRIEADKEEIVRLLNNLVSNAIKYNREGGKVTISAAQDGPYVKLTVSDTGIGISEDGLNRLFSEFFREKRPETAYITGTGLGLSIVKRIVDFYHGRITVDSQPGEGSTFTLWLPCKYEAVEVAA